MIDLTFLEQFTKGNTSKMQRYISMYLEVAPETFTKILQALSDQNWSEVGIHAHSLKPQADFMGAAELKDTLIEIEEAVKSEAHEVLTELVEAALYIHESAVGELQAQLAELAE